MPRPAPVVAVAGVPCCMLPLAFPLEFYFRLPLPRRRRAATWARAR